VKNAGEVRLNGGKYEKMTFQRPPNHQIEAAVSPMRKISSARCGFSLLLGAILILSGKDRFEL
jgi:hypothetical protein